LACIGIVANDINDFSLSDVAENPESARIKLPPYYCCEKLLKNRMGEKGIMKIKTIILLALLLIFNLSCAHESELKPKSPMSSNSLINTYRIGVDVLDSETGVTVKTVAPGMPAQTAGIKEGDILIKINNISISSIRELQKLLNTIPSESEVEITLIRDGNFRSIRLKPKIVKIGSIGLKLESLMRDSKVTVAVISGEVNYSLAGAGSEQVNEWKLSVKRILIDDAERALLLRFSNIENFRLVDRSIINKVLEEYKFNESGLVSDEMRIKLGKMYGVTHILKSDLSRSTFSKQSYEDIINFKLINLETGIIEASDYSRTVKE